MTREEAVNRLVAHRDELRAQGIKTLALFGSVARGEAMRHIPNEITSSYPSIPWSQMADMRTLIAHVYWGVDPLDLWDTIHQDLPSVIPQPKKVLEENSD